MNVKDAYRNAPHYDAEYPDLPDVAFLVEFATEYAQNGKVLELCCGTGRITFPLAEAGLHVTGLDVTPAMLDVARVKLANAPWQVQQRIKLIEGDMRFDSVGEESYDLVVIPFNSFLHMLTQQDQLAGLKNAFRHVRPGGYFLADIFLPDVNRLARHRTASLFELEKRVFMSDENAYLVRAGAFDYLPASQTLSATWVYQVFDADSMQLRYSYISPFEIRMIFPGEWELLLAKAGFEIVERWGNFDRAQFGEKSPRMLFVCRRPLS